MSIRPRLVPLQSGGPQRGMVTTVVVLFLIATVIFALSLMITRAATR
jgi:hypothetical protein